MQFESYPITTIHGFQFAKDHIMKTSKNKSCMQCGKPTTFVDVISEGYLCSDECEANWYENFRQLSQSNGDNK